MEGGDRRSMTELLAPALRDGEMAERVASFDWANSELGPRTGWSPGLEAAVGLLLDSPVGMVLLWGRDGVLIYNDAYIPVAGDRHPEALGRSARTIWPEIWDWNRDVIARGLRGEAMTYHDQSFTILRGGAHQEAWFDLFYAPVRGWGKNPVGVLCTTIETTGRVQVAARAAESERRLASSEARLSMLVNQASIGIVQSGELR